MAVNLDRVQMREWVLVAGPAILVVLGAFWLAYQFVQPAPPQRVVITTGGEGGAYFEFGKRYREVLAKAGFDLEVRTSGGSLDNVARLADPASGVQVALLQGGITNRSEHPEIQSLGRLYYEPLWVFYRDTAEHDALIDLKGKRLAVGPEGSGTRQLVLKLLGVNGLDGGNTTLIAKGGKDAVALLQGGQADALFMVAAPEAPLVKALLADPATRLMSFAQAEAYTRIFPFLYHITLPQGVVDLVQNLPAKDVHLVAPMAALVARTDLHPALIDLLTQAAMSVHAGPGMFHRAGDFPRTTDPEFAFSDDARRLYQSGPSFLQRYLPFWLANLIERSFILIVPLITILLPLFQVVPWLYSMRVRGRILYWYGQLKKLERSIKAGADPERIAAQHARLGEIEEAVTTLPVPLPYVEQVYDLRGHIAMVRQRLGGKGPEAAPALA